MKKIVLLASVILLMTRLGFAQENASGIKEDSGFIAEKLFTSIRKMS